MKLIRGIKSLCFAMAVLTASVLHFGGTAP
jgi:hypothetical protein